MNTFIPQLEPWIGRPEQRAVRRVVKSTFLTEGEETRNFEERMKNYTGAKHAIAMTNGTLALFAALKTLGIKDGDEVIVPDLTFIATANAVLLAGAKPVVCDVKLADFTLDENLLKKYINKRTKLIIPVYLYGQTPNLERLMEIAKSYELRVLEDAAQGMGVFYTNNSSGIMQHAGTIGDIGMISFYGNKTITSGEGGVLLTNNDEFADRLRIYKNHGRQKKGTFIHDQVGFNFAFTELQAAIGLSQLNKLEEIIRRKQLIHDYYDINLKHLKGLKIDKIFNQRNPVYWVSSVRIDNPEKVESRLKLHNIQTRRFFYPLHLQPCYQNQSFINFTKKEDWVSKNLYDQSLALPSSATLKNYQLKKIVNRLKKVVNEEN